MPEEPPDGELWASRFNLHLASTQRTFGSWTSQLAHTSTAPADENDEDAFKGLSEHAWIGSKSSNDSDDLPESVRRTRMSNDKLLEAIVGKKAAQAMIKKKERTGNTSQPNNPAPKPMAPTGPQLSKDDEGDEEEGGRAAAFSSRKKRKLSNAPAHTIAGDEMDEVPDLSEETPDPIFQQPHGALRQKFKGGNNVIMDEDEQEERSSKCQARSYLDELLAQKAKKIKKKRKKGSS